MNQKHTKALPPRKTKHDLSDSQAAVHRNAPGSSRRCFRSLVSEHTYLMVSLYEKHTYGQSFFLLLEYMNQSGLTNVGNTGKKCRKFRHFSNFRFIERVKLPATLSE